MEEISNHGNVCGKVAELVSELDIHKRAVEALFEAQLNDYKFDRTDNIRVELYNIKRKSTLIRNLIARGSVSAVGKFSQYSGDTNWRHYVVSAMYLIAVHLGIDEYISICNTIINSNDEDSGDDCVAGGGHRIVVRQKRPAIFPQKESRKRRDVSNRHVDWILEFRTFIHDTMIRSVRPDEEFTFSILSAVEDILRYETSIRQNTDVCDLKPLGNVGSVASRVILWRGDITCLKVGAIVNAGNPNLTGCFVPDHACVDNAVHSRAGPCLRIMCNSFLKEREFKESPVTFVELTSSYCLPSCNIIHTCGPNLDRYKELRPDLLAGCYMNALTMAGTRDDIDTIAFSCLCTGEYKYDQEEACKVALNAVRAWLGKYPNHMYISKVVFVLYTDRDVELYRYYAASIILGEPDVPNDTLMQMYPHAQQYPSPLLYNIHPTISEYIADIVGFVHSKPTRIVIFGGMGLSCVGGIDYLDTTKFASKFPAMIERGFENHYAVMLSWARGIFDKALSYFWAYLLMHAYNAAYAVPTQRSLCDFFAMLCTMDYFVYTESTDHFIERCGCSPNRVYTPSGSYKYYQCLNKECRHVFPVDQNNNITNTLLHVGVQYMEARHEDIPVCDKCKGRNVFLNLSILRDYNDVMYKQQEAAWNRFSSTCTNSDDGVLILALGAMRNPVLLGKINEFVDRLKAGSNPVYRLLYVDYGSPPLSGIREQSVDDCRQTILNPDGPHTTITCDINAFLIEFCRIFKIFS